jgi:hypothetical protein
METPAVICLQLAFSFENTIPRTWKLGRQVSSLVHSQLGFRKMPLKLRKQFLSFKITWVPLHFHCKFDTENLQDIGDKWALIPAAAEEEKSPDTPSCQSQPSLVPLLSCTASSRPSPGRPPTGLTKSLPGLSGKAVGTMGTRGSWGRGEGRGAHLQNWGVKLREQGTCPN